MMYLTLVVHLVLAICLIVLVLLQQGKGAEAGASFGGGASQTVFGSRGSTGFLAKLTGAMVALFFATSLFMYYQSGKAARPTVQTPAQQAPTAPTTLDNDDTASSVKRDTENKSAKRVDETPKRVDNAAPVQDKTPDGNQRETHRSAQ